VFTNFQTDEPFDTPHKILLGRSDDPDFRDIGPVPRKPSNQSKYATHPRRNGVISPITFGSERPRPIRTISLLCALVRFTDWGDG
jgi:hypothetical protein